MKQIEGDRNFAASVFLISHAGSMTDIVRPPLKTAPVFGGIAGIVAGEQVEPDDGGSASPHPVCVRPLV